MNACSGEREKTTVTRSGRGVDGHKDERDRDQHEKTDIEDIEEESKIATASTAKREKQTSGHMSCHERV